MAKRDKILIVILATIILAFVAIGALILFSTPHPAEGYGTINSSDISIVYGGVQKGQWPIEYAEKLTALSGIENYDFATQIAFKRYYHEGKSSNQIYDELGIDDPYEMKRIFDEISVMIDRIVDTLNDEGYADVYKYLEGKKPTGPKAGKPAIGNDIAEKLESQRQELKARGEWP